LNRSKACNSDANEGVRETQGRFQRHDRGLDDNADTNGALAIARGALGTFSETLSAVGAVPARPETQVVNHREDEPTTRSVYVGSLPA